MIEPFRNYKKEGVIGGSLQLKNKGKCGISSQGRGEEVSNKYDTIY